MSVLVENHVCCAGIKILFSEKWDIICFIFQHFLLFTILYPAFLMPSRHRWHFKDIYILLFSVNPTLSHSLLFLGRKNIPESSDSSKNPKREHSLRIINLLLLSFILLIFSLVINISKLYIVIHSSIYLHTVVYERI